MELGYVNIKNMLDGDVFGSGITEDGKRVIFQAERIGDWRADCDPYTGPLEDAELVFTAEWESKRTDKVVHYVRQWFHEDGTVEETFDHEILQLV